MRGSETPPNEEERSDREQQQQQQQQIRTEPHHDRALQQAAGLVQGALLEGGDGADAGRPAVLGKNHLRQRDCGNQARFITGLARVIDAAPLITERSSELTRCVRFSGVSADMK